MSFEEACVIEGFAGFQAGALGDWGAAVGEFFEGFGGGGCGEGLDGGAQGGSFGALHGDDGITEDVGKNLAPGGAFASAAGEADFGGFEAEGFHAAEAVGHAECDAFHSGSCHVGGREIRGVHAVQDAAALGEVRRSLALEVGQEDQAVSAGGNGGDFLVHTVVIPAEEVAEGLGGDGDIHGAEERHPVVGAVAECSDFALGVDDWLRSAGENRAACAEAGGYCAGSDVSRADGGHHVVPSPGADDDIRREAPCGGKSREEFSNWLGGGADGRKFGDEIVVDGGADLLAPLARADIEEGGAGGVTELHAQCACESEV